ncbi:hypothetical protein AVEN_39272-1 [Araneus ventricosus]|uniref:Tc1-like transposase DDE domain-containing protein n=1 Tax=Araneus ventricosus TaxID=182803 RepID=A0A4Y2MZR1_ARAVE|nr:hypothetical protein AVEN_39272-1 [Araneus ventricosus]
MFVGTEPKTATRNHGMCSLLDFVKANRFSVQSAGACVLPFSQHLHDEYALVTPIFQDDNSTAHLAGRICDWFDEYSHTLLHFDWPAKSPDLNPTENLWGRNQHPRNLVGLRDQILSEWLKLDATYLQNLVDSLPNRIQAVIKSIGGITRY